MCLETSASAKLLELLPDSGSILHHSDDRLGELAEEIFECFTTRRRVEPDGLLPQHVACVLEVYRKELDAPETVLSGIFSAMDPDRKGVATFDNFCDLFPAVMRLVQLRGEAREALQRQAEKMAAEQQAAAAGEESRQDGPGLEVQASAPGYMKATRTSQNKERPESARPDKSIPARRLTVTESNSKGQHTPAQMSIAAISIPHRDIRNMQKVFSEMDKEGNGLVSWDAIQQRCPSLPKEPTACGRLLGMDLTRETQFDLATLLRILYSDITVADSKALAKLGCHAKGFVLPKDKSEEIHDLFEAFDTAGKGTLSPGDLMQGLMRTGYTAEQTASAYITLMFDGARPDGITFQQFQEWYIADMLSESFKNANMGRQVEASP